MRRAERAGLDNHLCRLEKNLSKIQAFQEKGCAVEGSLGEIYCDLRDLGNYLKKVQSEKTVEADEELAQITERHKNLLITFESISNEASSQSSGVVIASKSTIPDFFYRITGRYQGIWKFFETLTTIFGVGIIGFILIALTYFFASGNIPFIQFNEGGITGINGLGFVVGVVLGLCVHEFAHGIVLANNGIKIKRVGMVAGFIVGGVIDADETTFFQAKPQVRLRFNAASIGANALVAVVLIFIGILISSKFLIFIALGDLLFGFLNSFPIRPLDGGWVYEDLVNIYLADKNIKEIFLSARFVILILWVVLFTYSALSPCP